MRKLTKKLKKLFPQFILVQLIFTIAILLTPLTSSAQTTKQLTESLGFKPQISIPGEGFDEGASIPVGDYNEATGEMRSDLLARYIIAIFNYALAAAAILATVVLMGAGVIWLTSGGDSSKITRAKELIGGSITGMVILACSWIILNTINPELTKLQSIDTKVVEPVSFRKVICCDPKAGPTEFSVNYINGKNIVLTGSQAGKELKCNNNASECLRWQICMKTDDKYACKNNTCGKKIGAICIDNVSLKCPSGYTRDLSGGESCGANRSCCYPSRSASDKQCGAIDDYSFCYPTNNLLLTCPENMEVNFFVVGVSCVKGHTCCYPDPENKKVGDGTEGW